MVGHNFSRCPASSQSQQCLGGGLQDDKDISAVAGDHDADLIKLALGQCHQDFKITGGNPQLTLDKGNSLHRTVMREEGPHIVARDVPGHPM